MVRNKTRLMTTLFVLSLLTLSRCAVDCITDSSQSECATYVYPSANATNDIDRNCQMMPYMPGCSIDTVCKEKKANGENTNNVKIYCDSFSVLADICAVDMPGMSPCKVAYVPLCNQANSTVQQCDQYPPIPGLPTTSQANSAIKSICTSHAMPGCEQCTIVEGYMNCDLLSVYSLLCMQMPDMPECAQWTIMCETLSDWPEFCPVAGAEQPPIMRMYFHTGIQEYLLFYTWVPRTEGEYIAAIIGIFFLAILLEIIQILRVAMEHKWIENLRDMGYTIINADGMASVTFRRLDSAESEEKVSLNGNLVITPQPFRFWVDLQRASLHVLEIFISYMLMLIVMTFNVGFLMVVLAGLFIGQFIFGRYKIYLAKPACC